MLNNKKYTPGQAMEYNTQELAQAQKLVSQQNEQIASLKRQNERLSGELAALKKKDKASSRALVLAERKAKYIGEVTKNRCAIEIDRLTRLSQRYSSLFDKLDEADRKQLEQFNNELEVVINGLGNLGEYIEDRKPLSSAEKNYISEKERISLNDAVKSDLDNRFNKLMSEFKQKIGESATRGRGRPKKSDQSILVEVNKASSAGNSNDLSEAEKQEVIDKINQLFYTVNPTGQAPVQAPVKKPKNASDNYFDFDEALNPTESLADIMKSLK